MGDDFAEALRREIALCIKPTPTPTTVRARLSFMIIQPGRAYHAGCKAAVIC